MKTVKRYTTFEDLKSSEKRPVDYKVRLKKHNEFEKFIMSLNSRSRGCCQQQGFHFRKSYRYIVVEFVGHKTDKGSESQTASYQIHTIKQSHIISGD
jgi:hypothetical protein